MKKTKDTDYLHISTRIRCVEGQLMNSTQLYRLAESKDAQEAEKLLEEKGWPAFDWRDMLKLEQVISQRRQQMMDLLYAHCPRPEMIEVFRLKYDYHNIKAILKGDAQQVDPTRLLSSAGLIPPRELLRMIREGDLEGMDPVMAQACLLYTSYSRIMALGLSGAVVGSVVNKMGAMGGGGIIGVLLFVVVAIIGHTFNIAISVLGAYVHTSRLQYIEFFGRFYEDGGRMMHPLKIKTKYVDVVKED